MDNSTGSPSLAHMAMLYGPRTKQELDTALGPFGKRRDEYRRRLKEDGIALTQEEAVEAYKLMAPLYPGEPDAETAALQAVRHTITFPCFETGGFGFQGPAVKAILEGFERAITEGSQTLHIQHHGEVQPRAGDAWDRFVAYKALEHFVDVMNAYARAGIRIVGELRDCLDRAQAILANQTVTRPRGRHDARLTLPRNGYINTMLLELEGCGLPVTSGAGGSLAGALAEVLGESESTIRKVWKEYPHRKPGVNDAAPDKYRLPERLIQREREYFAVGVRCADCGKTGRVPKHRARKGESRVCVRCLPLDGSLPPDC